ncbi:MAG: hypothetical protein ABFD54_06310 [Armatimonadota bacterium]|nr:hypothetical protein [bacterium]
MSSNVNWSNPYAERDEKWLKGNLHTHTSPASACGEISVEDCVNLYVERGYDFMSISDHMVYNSHTDNRLTFIPGIEWNAREGGGYHTGVYSLNSNDLHAPITIPDQDTLLEQLAATDAIVILNHPNWQMRPHYRREELEQRRNYDGIEIYNGVIERLDGYPISTDKWDYLLAKGIKVLGFASDDSHRATDIGLGGIHVRAKSASPTDIVAAIKSGNFYASSGALIDDIRMQNGVIELESSDAQEIQLLADGGCMIQRVRDKSLKVDTRDLRVSYVRFAVYGSGSSMAWTQPFFL